MINDTYEVTCRELNKINNFRTLPKIKYMDQNIFCVCNVMYNFNHNLNCKRRLVGLLTSADCYSKIK